MPHSCPQLQAQNRVHPRPRFLTKEQTWGPVPGLADPSATCWQESSYQEADRVLHILQEPVQQRQPSHILGAQTFPGREAGWGGVHNAPPPAPRTKLGTLQGNPGQLAPSRQHGTAPAPGCEKLGTLREETGGRAGRAERWAERKSGMWCSGRRPARWLSTHRPCTCPAPPFSPGRHRVCGTGP